MKTIAKNASDFADLRAVAMLYQTGYLTIKGYEDGDYLLYGSKERRVHEMRYERALKIPLLGAGARDGLRRPPDGRPVYLIGLAFDSQTRQLVDAAWEPSSLRDRALSGQG